MSQVEDEVVKRLRAALDASDAVTESVAEAVTAELAAPSPNAEKLANVFRLASGAAEQ